ncbi:MAG: M28 family peptidase [Anaerolineales bacterium]|nr:M28 family peptidase [Anaerolineales bacterium]
MNTRKKFVYVIVFLILFSITACSPGPENKINLDPNAIRFDGNKAFDIESEFVTQFTNRHSGTDQNWLATEWLREQFTQYGWNCSFDEWEVINYSEPLKLRNVVCRLPGEITEGRHEILVVAHHDQASTTIQGADNDGSGIAILLHLAEIFDAEKPLKYTLVFVATDAEEYGMLGSLRYIQTHPNTDDIIAGISLDNVGREYYDSMNMELVGQARKYGQIWFALTARDAARAVDGLWDVNLRAPIDQALDQAVPISFMDQGPMVTAGVPAVGFTGGYPMEFSDEHYRLWHDPDDTMARQSPESVGQSGAITEALIRQLLTMQEFPRESGPYLYFDESQQVFRGAPLGIIFIGFVGLFFLGSYLIGGRSLKEKRSAWRSVLPDFLGWWLPLVASVLLLYVFVAIGLMLEYDLYPATTKDPEILNPNWLAITLFLLGLASFLYIGRRLVRKYAGHLKSPSFKHTKSFALLIIGIVGIYILLVNPFSLLFIAPTLFWFLIQGRRGITKFIDIVLFLLGGLLVYALIYVFGFQTLRYNFTFLWMFLMMFAIQMIGFGTALISTGVIAAGLMLITNTSQEE